MSSGAKKLATYNDILALPDHMVGEIIDGELIVSPRPSSKHARASSILGGKITGPFDEGIGGGPGGWFILFEPEIHLGQSILVPDLAGWRISKLKVSPEDFFDKPFIAEVPQWVCEVISPGSAGRDKIKKRRIYLDVGVDYYWIIDPALELLEAYEAIQKNWSEVGTYAGNSSARIKPFDSIEINLGSLWAPRKPVF